MGVFHACGQAYLGFLKVEWVEMGGGRHQDLGTTRGSRVFF